MLDVRAAGETLRQLPRGRCRDRSTRPPPPDAGTGIGQVDPGVRAVRFERPPRGIAPSPPRSPGPLRPAVQSGPGAPSMMASTSSPETVLCVSSACATANTSLRFSVRQPVSSNSSWSLASTRVPRSLWRKLPIRAGPRPKSMLPPVIGRASRRRGRQPYRPWTSSPASKRRPPWRHAGPRRPRRSCRRRRTCVLRRATPGSTMMSASRSERHCDELVLRRDRPTRTPRCRRDVSIVAMSITDVPARAVRRHRVARLVDRRQRGAPA